MSISKAAAKNLRQLYLGELILLYLKGMNVVVPNEEMGQMDVTPMLQGIAMDVDETHIHLGDGEMINKSIRHEDYGLIELMMIQDSFSDMDMSALRDEDIN